MKVMVMIKNSGANEARVASKPELVEEMTAYNERLTKAGIMLDGGGLRPSTDGAQIVFEGGTTSVVDGPFTEAKEIIAGYWVWQVGSLEEAIEWAKQCPRHPDPNLRVVLEVRPYFDEEDLARARIGQE